MAEALEGEKNIMATLRETAQAYIAPSTLNVSEIEKIPIDVEVFQGTGTDKEGEDFTYHYIVIEEKKYRIPGSVIGGIKAIMKKMPQVKYVSVIKEGSGMNTRYQVIPWTDEMKM